PRRGAAWWSALPRRPPRAARACATVAWTAARHASTPLGARADPAGRPPGSPWPVPRARAPRGLGAHGGPARAGHPAARGASWSWAGAPAGGWRPGPVSPTLEPWLACPPPAGALCGGLPHHVLGATRTAAGRQRAVG